MLPYGRQWIDADDERAVLAALRSDWLTTGPLVPEFEGRFAEAVGARHAVAVSSGTAALHVAAAALGIGEGDEVIIPAMTFAATANCVVYQGGTPVFADVDPATLLVDVDSVAAKITDRTKAIIAVDYAGQPCAYDELAELARDRGISLAADAAHALGARYKDVPVGAVARLTTFSLHPVKHITTGEGGMITTADDALAQRMRTFRNHGITTEHRERETWFYEMVSLGYNYRLTDFQSALGISQLRKLPAWLKRRQAIARQYDDAFTGNPVVSPLSRTPGATHSYHLYVIRLNLDELATDRAAVFRGLRDDGIGVNVHYVPVHLHPYYRERFGTRAGMCPRAEAAYEQILSLPIFPRMTEDDVARVIEAVMKITSAR